MSSFRKSSLNADENASSTKASHNLVVRIDQDSDDNLQELFDSVLNPGDSKRPLQVPFRMRKLPNSFFNPPAATARSPSISHSRANSADSAYDAGSQSNVNQTTLNPTGSQVSIVSAVGAASTTSGATNNETSGATTAAAAANAANNNNNSNSNNNNNNQQIEAPKLSICHARAHSSPASLQQTYNLHTSGGGAGGNAAGSTVPEGGENGGNSSGFGNTAGTTGNTVTSAGGFSGLGIERLNQCIAQQSANNPIPTFHMKQRSYDVISPIQLQSELGALPPGWEQAKTNDGQIYYLNHITKTTQWEDPRIQYRLQQQQRAQQQLTQTVNLRNVTSGGNVGALSVAAVAAAGAGAIPNLSAATKEANAAVSLGDSLGPLPEGWEQAFTESGDIYFINHIDRTTSWNDPRIPDFLQKSLKVPTKTEMSWVNVRQLEKDQDFFKQKTEQQNILTRHSASHQMDPFLSGDNHARQESSDSGLSLSSNTFSVNTEFKSPIDDSMDCISENGTLNGLDCADNLVSSLQLDDSICDEMLYVHNMLSSPSAKPDNLEWYKIN